MHPAEHAEDRAVAASHVGAPAPGDVVHTPAGATQIAPPHARPADVAPVGPEHATQQAEAALRAGCPLDARAWLDAVIPEAAARRDRPTLRRATHLLGAAQLALGDLDAAAETLAGALEMGTQDSDPLVVARATNDLGAIARVQGRHADALACFHVAVPAFQRVGDPLGLGESFHHMAATFRDLGELARADQCERSAEGYAVEAGNAVLEASVRLGRAELRLRAGDAVGAETTARSIAATLDRLGAPIAQADALRLVGAACIAQRRYDEGRAALDAALTLARRHGSALHEAETLRTYAELADACGTPAEMRRHAEGAFALFARIGAMDEARRLVAWAAERVVMPTSGERPGSC